jgi:hypothetical protein
VSRPEGVTDAARALLAGNDDIKAVYEITLRDVDRFDEAPRLLTLIPIGSVIGVAVHDFGTRPKDEEIVFVAASALGNALPALGFTATGPAVSIVAPRDRA